jgi:alkylation response protein AidB-like acyl-CoA dehydrogenase
MRFSSSDQSHCEAGRFFIHRSVSGLLPFVTLSYAWFCYNNRLHRSNKRDHLMNLHTTKMYVFVAICALFMRPAIGQPDNPRQDKHPVTNVTNSELPTASKVLTELQDGQRKAANALVPQGELDALIHSGGGGACPSAAAIDALQALRLMAGLQPLANPHRAVLAAFANDKKRLEGRLTNEQFVSLLRFYERTHLEALSFTIDVELPPMSSFSPTGKTWSADDGPDLRIAPGQLKIVTFTITEPTGELVGRHFVLLKEAHDNEIVVLDPNEPTKDRRYVVSPKLKDELKSGHVFLLQPAGAPQRDRIFEINSIFTLTVPRAPLGMFKRAPNSAQELNDRIDVASEELRASGDLRSPRKWREKTASFGLPGLDLPLEYGGSAWPAAKVIEAFMCAGRHDLNCRDVVGGAHARLLIRSENPIILDVVRQVAAGKAYVAITMTEPQAGSDFHAIKSTARKVDGGYRLTGEKRYVARLEQATHVIIFTQAASGEPRRLSAFVLPIDTPGLERYSFGAHGLKGNSFGGLKFNDLFVADKQLLGADGQGDTIFVDHFRYWRLMQVGAALGTAERALELMAERLSSREAYGAPIGRFTHLQQALGQYTTELRMAKSLAREAAQMLDRGEYQSADPIISGLKAEGVEIALQAVDAATRAFGAEGYSDRVDLGDRLQDLNGLRIADGTTDVMRMDVVRTSYKNGRELWNMAVRGTK